MNTPHDALETLAKARAGGTLRAPEWDLIGTYLLGLGTRGIHEPIELQDRLERRGRQAAIDVVTGEVISFPREGRRAADRNRPR